MTEPSPPRGTVTHTAPLAADPMIGRRVGGYVITKRLAEGGMGALYVAEHPQLGMFRAVKVILGAAKNDMAVQRFLAEARIVATVRSPHIVELYDLDQFPDGVPYISMELLDGMDLSEHVRRFGPPPLAEAFRILIQICAGLHAAHRRAIVHRDLKEANVFLIKVPGNPCYVKLLDFGIAKSLFAANGAEATGPLEVFGTPGYMSPEQARGSAAVDARTDIYALGILAFRLLTGTKPYEADSIIELIVKQATQPPPDPSHIRLDLPRGWRDAFLEALAVNPEQRIATARAFADRLIAGFPDGEAIARAVAPSLFEEASDDATLHASRTPSALVARATQVAPLTTPPRTTPMAGAVGAAARTPHIGGRGNRWLLASGVFALTVAIAVVAVIATSGDPGTPAAATAAPPPAATAAASPPVAAAPQSAPDAGVAPSAPSAVADTTVLVDAGAPAASPATPAPGRRHRSHRKAETGTPATEGPIREMHFEEEGTP